MPIDHNRYYTVKAVAHELKTSEEQIIRWVKQYDINDEKMEGDYIPPLMVNFIRRQHLAETHPEAYDVLCSFCPDNNSYDRWITWLTYKKSGKLEYPENLVTAIGVGRVCGGYEYIPLSPEQLKGFEHILGLLEKTERDVLYFRYKERKTLEECREIFGISRQDILRIEQKALQKLRNPSWFTFSLEGLEKINAEHKNMESSFSEWEK